MRAERNYEQRSAWARRHGVDPERVVDEDYQGVPRKGVLEYELRVVVDGADGMPQHGPAGDVVTAPLVLTVPTDDPLPPRITFSN